MFLLHSLVWCDLQIRVLNLTLLCQPQQHYSICALKFILHIIYFFCGVFLSPCKFLICCSWLFCLLQSQTQKPALHFAVSHIILILDMTLSPLGWLQSLQDNQNSSENKFLQKEKRKTTSACAHTSDFFVSHIPLFPDQSCPTDCPKARDLTASKLLVILPKVGQPRNLAGLDTWKPHVPQLVSVL